jgi:hypothetical protein
MLRRWTRYALWAGDFRTLGVAGVQLRSIPERSCSEPLVERSRTGAISRTEPPKLISSEACLACPQV